MGNHYFIGIKIPRSNAEQLAEARNNWNLASHKRYPPAVDLHITLLFIGADPFDEIREVEKALEKVEQQSFTLAINGTDTFGNPEKPRVIHAALEESSELRSLQGQIKELIRPFRLKPDDKPFRPHITLANKWKGQEPIEQELSIEPASFEVKEFSLFRIEPAQEPRYIPVRTYHLKEDA